MQDDTSLARCLRGVIFLVAGGCLLRFGIVGLVHGSFYSRRHTPPLITLDSDPLTFWLDTLATCGLGLVGLAAAARELWLLYRQMQRLGEDSDGTDRRI